MSRKHSWFMLLLMAASSCASARFVAANPDKPHAMDSCQGTITRLDIPAAGDAIIWLKPDALYANLLPPGQVELRCEIIESRRARYTAILRQLEVGQTIGASGWLVVDRHAGSIHKLRPTTSIDLYPDK